MSRVMTRKRPKRNRTSPSGEFGSLFAGQNTFRIVLFVLTLLTVSRIHAHLGLGFLRPAALLAAGALGYALLNPKVVNWKALLRYWPTKVMAGLAVVACLSAPFGISLGGTAVFILSEYSKTLVFAALLIAAFRGAADVRLIVAAYVIGAGILVYYALFVFALSGGNRGVMRLSNLYTYDANDLGLMLVMAVPLALWLMGTVDRRGKALVASLLLGIGAALALSGSRGGFVGAAALALALLWFVRTIPLSKRLLVVAALGLGMTVMAPTGYWSQMETLLNPTEDYNWSSPSGRRQIWTRGLGYMWDYPVFGVGAGNFARAEGMISEIALTQTADRGVKWLAAHNSFIQAGAEMGITGLLLWSSLVFGGLVGMVRLRRRIPRWWTRGDPEQRFLYASTMYMPAAYVAFVVPAFFLSFAYMDPIYLLSALYCGIHAAVDRRIRLDRMARSAPRGVATQRGGGRSGPRIRGPGKRFA